MCDGEWIVKLYINSEWQEQADYFTNDAEDAGHTAVAMVNNQIDIQINKKEIIDITASIIEYEQGPLKQRMLSNCFRN